MPPRKQKKNMTASTASSKKTRKKRVKKPSWEAAMEHAVKSKIVKIHHWRFEGELTAELNKYDNFGFLAAEMNEADIEDQYPQVVELFHSNVDSKTYEKANKEMKHEWHIFKFSNDLKDLYISKLKDDLVMLQEQRTIMKYTEMEHIDDILCSFLNIVDKAVEEYKIRRDKLMRERFTFMNRNFRSAYHDVEYISKMKENMLKDHAEQMGHVTGMQRYEEEDHNKKSKVDLKHLLKDSLKEMLETYCEIKNVYVTYVKSTERKRRAFAQLKAKDREDDIIIEKLGVKIANLHTEKDELIKRMKMEHINAARIEDLESEKATLVDMLVKMRAQLKQDYAEDSAKLMHLTNICSTVTQQLQDREKLVEKILKYIILSHKYETLPEKIQPYSTMIERIDIAFNDEFPEYRDLDKFLFRMAQIEIHVDYMQRLLEKYQEQQRDLKCLVSEAVNTFYT